MLHAYVTRSVFIIIILAIKALLLRPGLESFYLLSALFCTLRSGTWAAQLLMPVTGVCGYIIPFFVDRHCLARHLLRGFRSLFSVVGGFVGKAQKPL